MLFFELQIAYLRFKTLNQRLILLRLILWIYFISFDFAFCITSCSQSEKERAH